MQHPDLKAIYECRFGGSLPRDAAGRLYDSRLREAVQGQPRIRRDRDRRAVEALMALRVASRAMRQVMDRWAERHGLSEGRLYLLFQLRRAPEHMLPLGELAVNLDVSPRNVTGLIDHLEEDGLVQRVHDREDRRSIHARLTPLGLSKVDGLRSEGLEAQLPIVRDFTMEELEMLRHLCLRVVENMTAGRTAVPAAARS